MKLSKLWDWDIVVILLAIAGILFVLSLISCAEFIAEMEKSLNPTALTEKEKAQIEEDILLMKQQAADPDKYLYTGIVPMTTVANEYKTAVVAKDIDTAAKLYKLFLYRQFKAIDKEKEMGNFFQVEKGDTIAIIHDALIIQGVVVITGPHQGQMGYTFRFLLRPQHAWKKLNPELEKKSKQVF